MSAHFRNLARDRAGGVSLMMAFALPALIGTLALGTEVSYWYVKNRALQNAVDSAVIAASIDGTDAYLKQAKAIITRYGLVDGVDGVTVTGSNRAACPAGGNDCYSITVTAAVPIYLGAVLDYIGNTKVDGVNATLISAMAVAKPGVGGLPYCLVALASNGADPGIASSGASKADLAGCGIVSNTGARCSGHDLGAAFGDAVGTNSGCGAVRNSRIPKPFADRYAALAATLPADPCGGKYPQLTGTLPTTSKWSGSLALGRVTTICGDLQLNGHVTITAPSDAVLIIRNGELATNGFRFQVSEGSGLALVFTGVSSASYAHIPNGAGELDITAPTTGTWAGIALYQDPALTDGIEMANAASKPAWAVTGLVYTPHANLLFNGSVGKASRGKRCTVLIANSITVKGNGLAISAAECAAAGLAAPNNGAGGRGTLVG